MPKITVWTVTTEGDNAPIETAVFATEAQAYSHLRDVIAGSIPTEDMPTDLASVADEDLPEVWSKHMDGPAIVELHEVEMGPEIEEPTTHRVINLMDALRASRALFNKDDSK